MSKPKDQNIWSADYLLNAHNACFENEASIVKSHKCGCFYCERIFYTSEISDEDWINDKNSNTALCPYCGIDAVIGDSAGYPLTQDFLHEMYLTWFK